MHNCVICARTSTKRYLVKWTHQRRLDVAEYRICDKTHCYNVLYSLVDDHHHMINSDSYTIESISDDMEDQNDDPF